ncbi:MAG: glutathionylspermidine synthase family protein [Pseudomonadota bacterium]|nr:glutathionylspermidine synthase family protein [Pseudomonadota bacterium]
MQRIPATQRANLELAAKEHGLEYVDGQGVIGWEERYYYQFTSTQIEEAIENVAEELEELCFQVVDRAVNTESVLDRLGIPENFWDYIAQSWRNNDKNFLGRMDFSYDGIRPPKLLEYNADTPTTLYETAVFQWEWLEHARDREIIPENCDQMNDVHESMVGAFSNFGIGGLTHFACNHEVEDDSGTLDYIEECAREAGLDSCSINMEDIGIDDLGRFTDVNKHNITTLVKLYPWEWLMEEEFGAHIPSSGILFIEPAWKAILSNKGLLPLLWGMFEGHPNLLPSFFDDDPAFSELVEGGNYVRKPLLSRQGANIEIFQNGNSLLKSDGPYGGGPNILQAFEPLPEFEGKYPLVGCWMVASKAVGLCVREDDTLITGNEARVIPHIILD